jgi:hypothetical protein
LSAETRKAATSYSRLKGEATRVENAINKGTYRPSPYALVPSLKEDALASLPYLGAGAGLGAGLGMTGLIEGMDPATGAAAFALLGGGLSALPQVGNLKFKGALAAASMVPRSAGPKAAGLSTVTAAPMVAGELGQRRADEEFSEYFAPETEQENFDEYFQPTE